MVLNGQIPAWMHRVFPDILFRKSTEGKVYLSFDDGPDPKATPIILKHLAQYNWKATFFVLGEQMSKHPEIIQQIVEEGHRLAYHGFSHLDGWKMKSDAFWRNAQEGMEQIPSKLFRPPYGRISTAGYRKRPADLQIVMWDVLSYDYDQKLSRKDRKRILQKYIQTGSIIVFHDKESCLDACLESLEDLRSILTIKGLEAEVL